MTEPSQTPNQRRRWIPGAALLATITIGILIVHQYVPSGTTQDQHLTFAVRCGTLVISLSESGTIQAQDKIIVKNTVPGNTAILWIVEEGTQVKQGDLLVELDSSEIQEHRFTQQIKVQNADALFVRAREDLAITQSQAESDIEKAEMDLSFAEQDLTKYIEGEYPQSLREAEVRITLAEEDLQRAEEKLKWSRVLFEQKFISQTELQADELSERKAALDLELARGKKNLLEQYTNKRDLAELQSDLKQSKMALARVRRKAKANIVQTEVDFRAKEMEFNRQSDKLEELEAHIKATRVIAPSDGLVLYATSAKRRQHGSGEEPLAPGRQVREREPLIHLPDTSKMMASIKVHETHVKRVSPGMPARITVDALPNALFTGRVEHIAPLPDATSFWLNPDLKVYDTQVYIDEGMEGLRNGMTCEVELVAGTYSDALSVPIQSVVRINGKPTVFTVNARGTAEPREVRVGGDNNRMVHILAGLTEGERVLLTPPLRDSEQSEDEDLRSHAASAKQETSSLREKQRAKQTEQQ
ncbi:MAG: efflux RND transporter periplasmic adaptor subunit [Verrucomicrobia bacterium]|jgi:HlyD family secretion protein|nr:efflux RND transporter periplasmic adaptor subunit [Verrucomicrobiota bacterium]